MGGDLLTTHDFEDWLKQEYNVKYMDLNKWKHVKEDDMDLCFFIWMMKREIIIF